MKRFVLLACLAVGMATISSCGVAENLAKAVGRTGSGLTNSVSNLGSSLSR